MSFIGINNQLNDDNVTATSHTVTGSASFTPITGISKSLNRSILDAYEYNSGPVAGSGTHVLTYTSAGSLIRFSDYDYLMIASLGNHFAESGTTNFNSFKITTQSGTYDTNAESTPVTYRKRVVDGRYLWDVVYILPKSELYDLNNVNISEIQCITSAASNQDMALGALFIGKAKDIDIKPSTLNYKFKTQGTKKRTLGGQIDASKNSSYMTSSFTTTATVEPEVISDYFDINYQSSISEPLIFLPQEQEKIILYGTQEKPNNTRCLLAKNGTDWLYETSFSIEEEL